MIRAPPSSNRAERRFPFSSLFRSRKRCPWRVFFVCDRRIAAHVDCVPDAEHFFEGAVEDTLDQVHGRFAGRVVLAHADLGSGQPARDACTAAMLSSKLAWFLRSEEHTSALQSLMRITSAVFCLKKKKYSTRNLYQ